MISVRKSLKPFKIHNERVSQAAEKTEQQKYMTAAQRHSKVTRSPIHSRYIPVILPSVFCRPMSVLVASEGLFPLSGLLTVVAGALTDPLPSTGRFRVSLDPAGLSAPPVPSVK